MQFRTPACRVVLVGFGFTGITVTLAKIVVVSRIQDILFLYGLSHRYVALSHFYGLLFAFVEFTSSFCSAQLYTYSIQTSGVRLRCLPVLLQDPEEVN